MINLVAGDHGIDVSKWQSIIRWKDVVTDVFAPKFAFIRASVGGGSDSRFVSNWKGSKDVGLQRGAYHYFSSKRDPMAQADVFLKLIKDDPGELPPVLDVEPYSGEIIADKQANTIAIRMWLDEVEHALNVKPIIYTANWAWALSTTQPVWANEYDLWVANYGVKTPLLPKGWDKYTFWQYNDRGSVSGVGGNCDLDVFNGN